MQSLHLAGEGDPQLGEFWEVSEQVEFFFQCQPPHQVGNALVFREFCIPEGIIRLCASHPRHPRCKPHTKPHTKHQSHSPTSQRTHPQPQPHRQSS